MSASSCSRAYDLTRRRSLMACVNCRQQKLKCLTSPSGPCERCARKKILCEYVSVAEQDDRDSASPTSPGFSDSPAPSATARGLVPSRPTPRPLPNTAPPPLGARPRYSGTSYPDLSLSRPQHPPAQPNPPAPAHENRNQAHYLPGGDYTTYHTTYTRPAAHVSYGQYPQAPGRNASATTARPYHPESHGAYLPTSFFAYASIPEEHGHQYANNWAGKA
ncbi:hypothetical protein GGX14DRAFT_405968 [Mycena pura]|uniref:Zn(2)-C6 fungal-type domain-containing protein n=1 Tax=Mycena pura TaxID=153505 RepID=A0AAD6UR87_9AGAR|nr:hypothetical protein GGX14DRAFT_405968 [Mycena pura]